MLKSHEFLSQQIDERSHQIFTMGPIFVPISFLIFASAITGMNVGLVSGFLLAGASLTCYLAWFLMYLRVGNLNELSYPVLHALELMLELPAHSTLNEFRKRKRLLRLRQEVFYVSLNILITLWMLFLLTFLVRFDSTTSFGISVFVVSLSFLLPIGLDLAGKKGAWNALSTLFVIMTTLVLFAGGMLNIVLAVASILFAGATLLCASLILGMMILIAKSVVSTFRDSQLYCSRARRKKTDTGSVETDTNEI